MEVTPTMTLKAILVVFILSICSPGQADITGRVVAVTDGDTIKVLDASNAAEHSGEPGAPDG